MRNALPSLCALFICVASAQSHEEVINAAQAVVLESLNDPDSAKFRNLQVVPIQSDPPTYRVCGEVNSKNAYGGYPGFQPFFVDGGTLYIADRSLSEPSMALLFSNHCLGTSEGATPDEDRRYLEAFELLKTGKYDGAIRGFRTLLAVWPDSSLADKALYWSGEAYYVKREFTSALDAFQEVVARHPASPLVPDAMLKTGLSQLELREKKAGGATLKTLVEAFPDSNAAKLAKQRMRWK